MVVTAAPTSGRLQLECLPLPFTTYVVLPAVGQPEHRQLHQDLGLGCGTGLRRGYVPRYTSGKHEGQCNTSPDAPDWRRAPSRSLR